MTLDPPQHHFPWRITAVIAAIVIGASVLTGLLLGQQRVGSDQPVPSSSTTASPLPSPGARPALPLADQRQLTLLLTVRDDERAAVSSVLIGVGGQTGFVSELLLPRDLLLPTTPPRRRAEVDDPTGLGRIVRGGDGRVRAIVEERDATDEQRAIREINAGLYVGDAAALRGALARLDSENDQGELYLTDVLAILVADGARVGGAPAEDPVDVLGCNDHRELAARRRVLNDRVLDALMVSGVTVVDPMTTWVDVTASVAPDAVLQPGVHLLGGSTVAAHAVVGPDTTLVDCEVAEGATVLRSHCLQAVIGPGATVGPFSYLRPGTRLATEAKVGAYVETKNAEIGERSKVPHLSYVGDATIGRGANVGAATVFVNYDGVHKHHTTIGDEVRIGSDTMLVAPVTVGDGAYTAAGSVIVSDVPPGAMAVARAAQRNVGGWVRRRRAGTPAAAAAEAAERRADSGGGDRSGEPGTDDR